VDETYIKVNGRWCYLYRAIDRTGALVDVMLSETRDMAAADEVLSICQSGHWRYSSPGDHRRA
jgi:transposase-like protein